MATIVFHLGFSIVVAAGVAIGPVKHPPNPVTEGHVGMLINGEGGRERGGS